MPPLARRSGIYYKSFLAYWSFTKNVNIAKKNYLDEIVLKISTILFKA